MQTGFPGALRRSRMFYRTGLGWIMSHFGGQSCIVPTGTFFRKLTDHNFRAFLSSLAQRMAERSKFDLNISEKLVIFKISLEHWHFFTSKVCGLIEQMQIPDVPENLLSFLMQNPASLYVLF